MRRFVHDCAVARAGLVVCESAAPGSHTGHKWAELLFATRQTGSSTAQPKELVNNMRRQQRD